MSILIKNMEMPKNCWSCALGIYCNEHIVCMLIAKDVSENSRCRDTECPLEHIVEVKPYTYDGPIGGFHDD